MLYDAYVLFSSTSPIIFDIQDTTIQTLRTKLISIEAGDLLMSIWPSGCY